eukprot:2444134-Prymnesium_polylepis.1
MRVVATALGVREKPSVSDWIACTNEVAASMASAAQGPNDLLLPPDVAAIHAAVVGIVAASAASEPAASERADIYLIDDDSNLRLSSELVYADLVALKHRCCLNVMHELQLHFLHSELVRPPGSGEALVRHSTLSKLSDVVTEVVASGQAQVPRGELNQFDDAFEKLLRSQELAGAY